jgi:hypothetical protein
MGGGGRVRTTLQTLPSGQVCATWTVPFSSTHLYKSASATEAQAHKQTADKRRNMVLTDLSPEDFPL